MLADAEVSYLRVVVRRNENVGRLYVSMHIPSCVQKGETTRRLSRHAYAQTKREGAALRRRHVQLQKAIERPPFKVFHDDGEPGFVQHRPHEAANARMPQLRQRLSLEVKGRPVCTWHLDRNLRAKPVTNVNCGVCALAHDVFTVVDVHLRQRWFRRSGRRRTKGGLAVCLESSIEAIAGGERSR